MRAKSVHKRVSTGLLVAINTHSGLNKVFELHALLASGCNDVASGILKS